MNTLDFVDLLQEFNELQTGWLEERMPDTIWTDAGKLDESQTGHQAPEPQATVEERNKQPHQEGLMNNDPNGPHQQQQVLFQLLDNIDPQQTFSQGTESTVQQVNTDPNGSTQQHAEPLQVQDTGDLTAIVHQELHNMDQQIPNSYSAPEDNNGKNYQSEIEGEPQQSQQELLGNNDPYLWHDISQTIQQDLESTTQQPQQEQPRETDPNRIQQQPLNNDDLEDLGDLSNYLAQINQNQSKMAETITPQNVKERYEIEFTIDAKPIIIKLNLNKASRWCRECDKTFTRVYNLKRHQFQNHGISIESKRRCKFCNIIHPTQAKAMKHQLTCKEEQNYKPYLCTICNIAFHKHAQAVQHKKDEHIRCRFCKKRYIHNNKNCGCEAYKCNEQECLFETKHLGNLRQHKQRVHPSIVLCDKPDCTFQTKHPYELKEHKKQAHPVMKICDDPECTFETIHQNKLLEHKKQTHPTLIICDEPGCMFETIHKTKLNGHRKQAHPKAIVCNEPKCTFETIYQAKLIEHKRQAHIHITKCTEPGCTYETRYKNIHRHQRTVHAKPTQNKQHECTEPQCQYKTNDKSNFKRHLKSHKHTH